MLNSVDGPDSGGVKPPGRLGQSLALPLVYRLLNPLSFAAGKLAVFQGASEGPISDHTGRASNAEKQPTGPSPEGCVENRPAALLLVGYVSI
jgi:hypothetical protein